MLEQDFIDIDQKPVIVKQISDLMLELAKIDSRKSRKLKRYLSHLSFELARDDIGTG